MAAYPSCMHRWNSSISTRLPTDQRRALVDLLGLDVQDSLPAVGRHAAGLFGEKRHRVGFVQQTQFSRRTVGQSADTGTRLL